MINTVISHIAVGWGILILIWTTSLSIRGQLTWRNYFIGMGVGTFCSAMGLWNLGAF